MVAAKLESAKRGAKKKMTLKCKNCKMNSKCICIPDSDECILRWETYKMIKRQAHSEAIKNLIELPCKIGDTVYIVTPKSKTVTAYEITGYSSGYGKGFIPVPEVLTEKQDKNEIVFYFSNDGRFEEEHIYDYQDCMEVIGNIFDNKDLLEKEFFE